MKIYNDNPNITAFLMAHYMDENVMWAQRKYAKEIRFYIPNEYFYAIWFNEILYSDTNWRANYFYLKLNESNSHYTRQSNWDDIFLNQHDALNWCANKWAENIE